MESGRPQRPQGLEAFHRQHADAVPVIVGTGGIPLADFFAAEPGDLLAALSRG